MAAETGGRETPSRESSDNYGLPAQIKMRWQGLGTGDDHDDASSYSSLNLSNMDDKSVSDASSMNGGLPKELRQKLDNRAADTASDVYEHSLFLGARTQSDCESGVSEKSFNHNDHFETASGMSGMASVERMQLHQQQQQQQSKAKEGSKLTPEQIQAMLVSVPLDENGVATSVGSMHHAARGCAPCLFKFSEFGCENGIMCEYCHFPHSTSAKPRNSSLKDKRDRYDKLVSRMERMVERNGPEAAPGSDAAEMPPFSPLDDQLDGSQYETEQPSSPAAPAEGMGGGYIPRAPPPEYAVEDSPDASPAVGQPSAKPYKISL
jgi:hypothetical protein